MNHSLTTQEGMQTNQVRAIKEYNHTIKYVNNVCEGIWLNLSEEDRKEIESS